MADRIAGLVGAVVISVFVSSPGDVLKERATVERVIGVLNERFAGRVELRPFFWEDEPQRATADFQANCPLPSELDVYLGLLWSKLGTPLHPRRYQRADGSAYESGTVFELEDAIRGHTSRGSPDVFVFRSTAPVAVSPGNPDEDAAQFAERARLYDFCDRFFREGPGEPFTRGYQRFATPKALEDQVEAALLSVIAQREVELPQWDGCPYRGLSPFEGIVQGEDAFRLRPHSRGWRQPRP